MTPEVSAVVVSHRSAAEAVACVESLREEFVLAGLSGEVVLVDCASGEQEARALREARADALLLLPENRGYSGGANAGLARARSALLVVCNADVLFERGAVPALLSAVEDARVGVAGPLCFWDAGGRLRMPAGFAPGFLRDLLQLCAGRLPALDRRRFAAAARESLRLWEHGGEVRHLTGAVLAARRDVFDRAGRFDERFLFEYEESEWEQRVRAAGLVLRFEPRARVRHLYARSASRSPEAGSRREASRRFYRRRRYGTLGAGILERAAPLSRRPAAAPLARPELPRRPGAALALSPNPSVLPFVGAALDRDFALPPEVLPSLAPGPLYLRVFRENDGEPLETFVWDRPQ